MLRQRRWWSGAVALLAVLACTTGPVSPASAADEGVAANCGGYTLVSAQSVRLRNGSSTAVGSIQLCKRYISGQGYLYFGRLEMYDTLPAGRLATAYVYTADSNLMTSCDDNTGAINPGERICYTGSLSVQTSYRAVGRAWTTNTGSLVLYAEGVTGTGR